jgi:hypothetical protein
VASWNFPPLNEGFDYVGAMRALASEEIQPVKDQHVVSKVVLKGFASPPAGRQGWQLARYDKARQRELDPKGLNACGKVVGFIQYASGSAEALWQEVENRLDAAIKSAEAGTLHENEAHVKTIKDGIALHLVRTPHYRRLHESSFVEAMSAVRKDMLENKQVMLAEEFRRRYGLEPAGVEALDVLLHEYFDKWTEYERSGQLLRVSLEQNFYRVRSVLDELAVEVAHVPLGKELIISDAPAFTFQHNADGEMALRMAVGDSHGIAMPITSRCFVAIGPEPKEAELSANMVDRLNQVQVQLAERQLYYRPGSAVKGLIEAALVQMSDDLTIP